MAATSPARTFAIGPAAATRRLLVSGWSPTVESPSARTPGTSRHATPWPSTSCVMSQAAYASTATAAIVHRLDCARLLDSLAVTSRSASLLVHHAQRPRE